MFASFNDVRTIDVPLSPSDFQLRLPEITAALTPAVKLVFLCSPGNPTSRLLRTFDVEAVAAAATGALVVVDEAYIDYAPDALSCSAMVGRIPNVVVMQTFSKAWGLAGARVGFAMAPEALVAIVDRVKAPFNLSALAEEAATRAVAAADVVRAQRDTLLRERDRVAAALRAPALAHAVRRVVSSDANFLLVQIDACRAVCEQLRSGGVVVRYRGAMLHCTECARVSIGTREENDAMLAALTQAVGQPV
jgi:histidinol-phosphate aminotransferase